MGGLADILFGKIDKEVAPPIPPPTIASEGEEASERERRRRRRARGRASTILTVGQPLGAATVRRSTLGGV